MKDKGLETPVSEMVDAVGEEGKREKRIRRVGKKKDKASVIKVHFGLSNIQRRRAVLYASKQYIVCGRTIPILIWLRMIRDVLWKSIAVLSVPVAFFL